MWILHKLSRLSSNKFFIGIMVLMLNIASKYITIELSMTQRQFFENKIARQFLIFAITFLGTRDIVIAVILTASFHVLSMHLFNEQSKHCVIPKKWRQFSKLIDKNKDDIISRSEIQHAIKILKKAKKQEQRQKYLQTIHNFDGVY